MFMATSFEWKKWYRILPALAVVFFFLISGCTTGIGRSKYASRSASASYKKKNTPLYLDFKDILIPNELKEDRKASFTYQSQGLSMGVISLSGRVELKSLIAFFERQMPGNNWRLISKFRSPHSMLLFYKEGRWCIINITEKEFKTYVKLWVAPTATATGGIPEEGLFK